MCVCVSVCLCVCVCSGKVEYHLLKLYEQDVWMKLYCKEEAEAIETMLKMDQIIMQCLCLLNVQQNQFKVSM